MRFIGCALGVLGFAVWGGSVCAQPTTSTQVGIPVRPAAESSFGASAAQPALELDQAREARIREHQAKIDKIIEANRARYGSTLAEGDKAVEGNGPAGNVARCAETSGPAVLVRVAFAEVPVERVVAELTRQTSIPVRVRRGVRGTRVTLVGRDVSLERALDLLVSQKPSHFA